MTPKDIVLITLNEENNILFEINPNVPIHSIIGALQMVRRVLEAQVIEGVLSVKNTDKTNINEHNDSKSKADPS